MLRIMEAGFVLMAVAMSMAVAMLVTLVLAMIMLVKVFMPVSMFVTVLVRVFVSATVLMVMSVAMTMFMIVSLFMFMFVLVLHFFAILQLDPTDLPGPVGHTQELLFDLRSPKLSYKPRSLQVDTELFRRPRPINGFLL
jgi:hypothetical protein